MVHWQFLLYKSYTCAEPCHATPAQLGTAIHRLYSNTALYTIHAKHHPSGVHTRLTRVRPTAFTFMLKGTATILTGLSPTFESRFPGRPPLESCPQKDRRIIVGVPFTLFEVRSIQRTTVDTQTGYTATHPKLGDRTVDLGGTWSARPASGCSQACYCAAARAPARRRGPLAATPPHRRRRPLGHAQKRVAAGPCAGRSLGVRLSDSRQSRSG